MASILERENDNSDSNLRKRRRRNALHFDCGTKKTLVAAAAALVCISFPNAAIASSRHIPPGRHVSSPSRQNSRFRFSPQHASDSLRPRMSPSSSAAMEAASSSPTSLQLSSSPEELPSHFNETTCREDDTKVTTTFFRFPSDSAKQEESRQPEKPVPSVVTSELPTKKVHEYFVLSLMGLAGFVEGFCFRRHGCFPNLMTGTILKVAEAVGNLNFATAGIQASMLGCYTGGALIYHKWKLNNAFTAKTIKHEKIKSSLRAVSVISGLCLLLSDIFGSLPTFASLKLPMLAAGFGVINAGTFDVGAGVTFAMTGHVNKVGEGVAIGKFKFSRSNTDPSVHRTSAKGLVFFWVSALLANLLCGILEQSRSLAKTVLEKVPLGSTLVLIYALLFRWYASATARASASEAKME